MSYSGRARLRSNRMLVCLTHAGRSTDVAARKQYVDLVESVREKGAEVLIFSSMHESGQRKEHRMQNPPLNTSADAN
jgi:uncharacterized phosphosugar-binding protein